MTFATGPVLARARSGALHAARNLLTAALILTLLAFAAGVVEAAALPPGVAAFIALAFVARAYLNPVNVRMLGVAVVGQIGEDNTPGSHKMRHVDQRLTLRAPQANPLNVLMRRMRRAPRALAEKVEWETDEVLPRLTLTTGATTAAAAGTAQVLPVANASYYLPDDLLLLTANSTARDGVLIVESVNTGTGQITVRRWDGGGNAAYGTVPAIGNGEKLVRMGNLKEEGYGFSAPRATMPVLEYNLIEDVDATIEMTRRRQNTKNYTVQDWQRSRDRQLYDFLSNEEFKLFYGKREKKSVIKGGKLVNITSMGGLANFNIPKQLTYSASTLSQLDVIEWHRVTFSGNAGSPVRYAFCDDQFAADMAKITMDQVRRTDIESKVLNFGVVETRMLGLGTIRWIPSQMFAQAGKSRVAWIIDLANCDFVPFLDMDTTTRGKKETGTNVIQVNISESYTSKWAYLDTHTLIEGTP